MPLDFSRVHPKNTKQNKKPQQTNPNQSKAVCPGRNLNLYVTAKGTEIDEFP